MAEHLAYPCGRPVALSPLDTCQSLSIVSPPLLHLLPEAYKFTRSISNTSTVVPDDLTLSDKLARTVSGSSTVVPDSPLERTRSQAEPCGARRMLGAGKVSSAGAAEQASGTWSPSSEALRDGPALTYDGRALELDGGIAIHFSYDRRFSAGEQHKSMLKDSIRLLHALRRAQAAREAEEGIENGEVCSIDAKGVLRGCLPRGAEASGCAQQRDTASRLKLFRRKRMARRGPPRSDFVACAGPDNRVFVLLPQGPTNEQRHRQQRKRGEVPTTVTQEGGAVLVVDCWGRVRLGGEEEEE